LYTNFNESGVSVTRQTRWDEKVDGKTATFKDADTALRFARYFKNRPAFWMNLQTRYELEVAEDELADKVAREVQPLEVASGR
jgi:plasmid maintenance system antidote protein VapI